jgi:hypothetical protein
MEDVSFSHGEIIFVDEFPEQRVIGKTLRVIGRLVSYNAKIQKALISDPDDDSKTLRLDVSLLPSVSSTTTDGLISVIGEVYENDNGFYLRPRVIANSVKGLDYNLMRKLVVSRRRHLIQSRIDDILKNLNV